MKEYTVNGIASSSIDFRENDKIVKIITAEMGVISVVCKGVKKEKAKLKFAAMPFSFCKYTIFERGDYKTLKTAELEGSLINLADDANSYIESAIILEAGSIAMGEQKSPEIFIYLLNCLHAIVDKKPSDVVCANFMLKMLIGSGNYVETAIDLPFQCDIRMQEDLCRDVAVDRLCYYISVFEKLFSRKLKSAKLLVI